MLKRIKWVIYRGIIFFIACHLISLNILELKQQAVSYVVPLPLHSLALVLVQLFFCSQSVFFFFFFLVKTYQLPEPREHYNSSNIAIGSFPSPCITYNMKPNVPRSFFFRALVSPYQKDSVSTCSSRHDMYVVATNSYLFPDHPSLDHSLYRNIEKLTNWPPQFCPDLLINQRADWTLGAKHVGPPFSVECYGWHGWKQAGTASVVSAVATASAIQSRHPEAC